MSKQHETPKPNPDAKPVEQKVFFKRSGRCLDESVGLRFEVKSYRPVAEASPIIQSAGKAPVESANAAPPPPSSSNDKK